jgi:Asp-tRNA(Asn)/Glu-tRNA(Gln) amidotransferase A subunit family amidase
VFESLVQKLSLMGMECRSVEFDSEFSAINRWQDEVMQNGGRFAFLPEALMAPHALHDDFKAKLNNHLGLKGSAIRHALNQIDRCRIQFEGQLEGLDGVLTLSAPGIAPLGLHTQGMATFNRMWTALQVPCINVPALWSAAGMPIGLQLVHARFEETKLLSCLLTLMPHLDANRYSWSSK